MRSERVKIIGVPISAVNMDSCIQEIFSNWDEAKGNYICVSNVHTTVMAHDDEQYMAVQSGSFLSLPDGKPLSVVGRKRYPQMDRVTGPDFMRRVFEESRDRKLRHYFYGNTAENLEKLIETIKVEYPHLEIVGYEPSVFRNLSAEEENALAEKINASHADFVWVGLGAPRQEFFCARMKGRTDGVMVGVGGAFNVLAHIVPEAPRWMQDLSLEWLYRLIQEPKRLFKRYLTTNSRFILLLMTERNKK